MTAAITLSQPLPALVRVGQSITVAGHLKPPTPKTEIALEYRAPDGLAPKKWTILAEAGATPGGQFKLRWQVTRATTTVILSLRVAAIRHGKTLASTKAVQSAIGPAPVPCTAPVPPAVNIPVGDGWIEGGSYIEGGAFPGVDECQSQTYTITATNTATGAVAATMTVAGGSSYTLVVPAGTYSLSAAGGCPGRGQATVTAGMGTTADADCAVP